MSVFLHYHVALVDTIMTLILRKVFWHFLKFATNCFTHLPQQVCANKVLHRFNTHSMSGNLLESRLELEKVIRAVAFSIFRDSASDTGWPLAFTSSHWSSLRVHVERASWVLKVPVHKSYFDTGTAVKQASFIKLSRFASLSTF